MESKGDLAFESCFVFWSLRLFMSYGLSKDSQRHLKVLHILLMTHVAPLILQSIAKMCFQQGKLVASFFFSQNASGHDNETRFISTIVYQLVLSIPKIKDAINKALQDDPLLLSQMLHVQVQSLITKPLNDLLASSGELNGFQPPWPWFIIVNSLDECGQAKNQRYVLDVLSTVTRHLTYPLLFFIASWPEQVICDSFSEKSMCSITTRV